MAWPYTFSNVTNANGSWLDANFSAAVQAGTAATLSTLDLSAQPGGGGAVLSLTGGSGAWFGPSNVSSHTGAMLNLANSVFIDATANNGAINLSAPNGLTTPGNAAGFGFNLTMPQGSQGGISLNQTGTGSLQGLHINLSSTSAWFAGFDYAGTQIGAITPNSTGNGVTYATTSDATLKTAHGPSDGSLLSALPIRDCTFTSDGPNATPRPMVLAQELAALAPYAVTEAGATGAPLLMVDHSALVPELIAYVQSLDKALKAVIGAVQAIEQSLPSAPSALASTVAGLPPKTTAACAAAQAAVAAATASPAVQGALARGAAST